YFDGNGDPVRIAAGYAAVEQDYDENNKAIAERYFDVDGVRYHHILDPATGRPASNGIHGVTIVSESGFLSDALSTACFVLGQKKGMALAEKYGAAILMVDDRGEVLMNDAMKSIYSPAK
ncbi:MAG: FAD:protein FMN transferase, partial [Lachnospiraceae bacterium]|nr:FAD:protein FMN transferase [Lachnospiraceae bacterium]